MSSHPTARNAALVDRGDPRHGRGYGAFSGQRRAIMACVEFPEESVTTARPELPDGAADQAYVWLTTVGRRSGLERTVELWFALTGSTLYFLAGGGMSAGWVQNSLAAGSVNVRVAAGTYRGRARAVEPGTVEDGAARRLLAAKYQGWSGGRALSSWARNSFCVAIDLIELTT